MPTVPSAQSDGASVARNGSPGRFVYIDDGVPEIGTQLLHASCEEKGVEFVAIDAERFVFDPPQRLTRGDMLYRPAVSALAQEVEQHLHAPGVATFYTTDEQVYFAPLNPLLVYARAGLPVPRTIFCHRADRPLLDAYAARLGGFPLLCKLAGFSGGVGVVRCDTAAGLYSVADALLAVGRTFAVQAYVPDAVHWRLVVVGARVIASYRNEPDAGDFRTHATDVAANYEAAPPAAMADVAVRATHLGGVELGGVDLLEHTPSGRCYLLEMNFPCYFAQAQEVAGVDVSGAMVDHLLRKARRFVSGA